MPALASGAPSQGPDSASSSTRASVWIVDDSPVEGEMIREALAPNFDLTVFPGGAVVLERLSVGESPDVLVLDWHLPDVSGAEVCRFIRATFNSAQLPIAILTAFATSEALLDALTSGANDFVRKPVSALELNARVAGLVRLTMLHSRLSETERKLRLEAIFRERFMGMLAHDLRQPLSTIVMGFQLLSQMSLPGNGAAVVERQLRAAERMGRMVTDLLDSTRYRPESGMPIEKRPTDFAEVARKSLDEVRSANPDRQFELSVTGSCTGHWDPDRMAQVLSNLVGNALAHGGPSCRVEVRVTATDAAVELRVVNQGRPIPEEIIATLGQPFVRSRNATQSSAGLGLGLHIVHQIVLAHGGGLSVQSEGGQTQVIVRLPREELESRTPPAPSAR